MKRKFITLTALVSLSLTLNVYALPVGGTAAGDGGATGSALPSGRVTAAGTLPAGEALPASPVGAPNLSAVKITRVAADKYVTAAVAENFVYLADRLNPDGTLPPDANGIVIDGKGKTHKVPQSLNIEKVYSNRPNQVSHIYLMADVAGGEHGLLKQDGKFLNDKTYVYAGVYGNYAVLADSGTLSVVNSKTEKSVMTYKIPASFGKIASLYAAKTGDYHQFELTNANGDTITYTVTLKWKSAKLSSDILLTGYDKDKNQYYASEAVKDDPLTADKPSVYYLLDKNLKIVKDSDEPFVPPAAEGELRYLNTHVVPKKVDGKDYIYIYRVGKNDEKLVKKLEGKGAAAVTKNKVFVAAESGGLVFDAKTVKYKTIKGNFNNAQTISASADTVILTKVKKSGSKYKIDGYCLADRNGKIYTKTYGSILPVSTSELAMGSKANGFSLYGLKGTKLFTTETRTAEYVKQGQILAARRSAMTVWELFHSVTGSYTKFDVINGVVTDNTSVLSPTASGTYFVFLQDKAGSSKFGVGIITTV